MDQKGTSRGSSPAGTAALADRIQQMHEQQQEVRQARLRNLLLWAVLKSLVLRERGPHAANAMAAIHPKRVKLRSGLRRFEPRSRKRLCGRVLL